MNWMRVLPDHQIEAALPLDNADCDLRRIGAHPDFWYPLAWSDELRSGRVIGREFAGRPIALYRGKSGRVFALEDRCAHRQVPLHLGKVEGESLKCGYHGWTYDCAGACVDVPYLGREKLPNGVSAYPVLEQDGIIFVFPGDPAKAESLKPRAPSVTDSRYKTRALKRDVACHYSFMHENLFDMNHQFLHRKQMGLIKAACLDRRVGKDWCEVDYTFGRTGGGQSIGEAAILGAIRPGANTGARDLMTIRTEYPYQTLRVWVGGGEPVLSVWLCYTPIGRDQRRNRTFGFLSVKKAKIPGLTRLAWPFITWFTERIFGEDKEIVEQEQAAWEAQGGDWNNEVFPAINDLRALLRRNGQAASAGEIPQRPEGL
jgi:phenylpropionate dioxygenase-like ring-hydroxylating dioxygenase large terminal subunit